MFGAIIGILFGLYVIAAVINVIGVIIGAVFSGVFSVIGGAFSGEGLVIGIILGVVAFYYFRNRKKEEAASPDHIGTVDGAEAGRVFDPDRLLRRFGRRGASPPRRAAPHEKETGRSRR